MLSKLKRLFVSKYFSLSFVFVFANLIANILNYVFHFFVSRAYGPATYGEVVSFFSHLYILGIPSLIFNTFVVKYIGRGKTEQDQLIRFARLYSTFKFRSFKLLIFLLPLLILLFFIGLRDNLSSTSSLAMVFLFLISILLTYLTSFLRAFQAFFILSFALVLSVSFKVLGSFVVYFFHLSSLSFIWLFLSLGTVFQFLILYKYFYFHYLKNCTLATVSPLNFKTLKTKLFSRQYLFMILTLISITAIVNLDTIFARVKLAPEMSGFYGAWSMLAKIIMYAGGPISTVAFTFFANQKHQRYNHRLLLFSSLINFVFGLGLLCLYLLFGKLVVLSLFGRSFLFVANYLASAAIFGLLYSLIANLNNYFISQDSSASLLPLLFLIFQIIAFVFWGNTFANLIHIQLVLASLTLLFQFIALAKTAK